MPTKLNVCRCGKLLKHNAVKAGIRLCDDCLAKAIEDTIYQLVEEKHPSVIWRDNRTGKFYADRALTIELK